MTPGPVEEASAAARAAITGLSTSPVILALVMMQLILLISIAYVALRRLETQSRDFRLIVERCLAPTRLPSSTTTPPDD